MKLRSDEARPSATRLKRAQGQLSAVIRMLEECEECEDVVMQLSAVSKNLDQAGYLAMVTRMKKCFTEEGPDSLDEKQLEKMFRSLT